VGNVFLLPTVSGGQKNALPTLQNSGSFCEPNHNSSGGIESSGISSNLTWGGFLVYGCCKKVTCIQGVICVIMIDKLQFSIAAFWFAWRILSMFKQAAAISTNFIRRIKV